MDYKQFIIGMILSMSKNHDKQELYTMNIRELVYLKDRLLEIQSNFLGIWLSSITFGLMEIKNLKKIK